MGLVGEWPKEGCRGAHAAHDRRRHGGRAGPSCSSASCSAAQFVALQRLSGSCARKQQRPPVPQGPSGARGSRVLAAVRFAGRPAQRSAQEGGVVAREPRESSAGRRVLRWGVGCLPSCRRLRQLVAAVGTLLPHSMAFQGRSGASQRLFLAGERANRGQNKGLSAGSPCSVWWTEQAQSVDRYPTVQPQSAT